MVVDSDRCGAGAKCANFGHSSMRAVEASEIDRSEAHRPAESSGSPPDHGIDAVARL